MIEVKGAQQRALQTRPVAFSRDLSSYRGRRVMVTGGLGFIGSNLALTLGALGARVVVVDALIAGEGGNPRNLELDRPEIQGSIEVHLVDLRDHERTGPLLEGCEVVFNLAGEISHLDSMRNPLNDLAINCASQLALLESARQRSPEAHVVYASTRQVYGRAERLPADERHPTRPTDINGIHKLVAEEYHRLYHEYHGLITTSLRLTNIYGPRQSLSHDRQGFAPWFVRQAIDGQEIQLFGDGRQRRALIFVDDAVEAFLLVGASETGAGLAFNVGGAPAVELLEFVTCLIDVAGSGSYRLVPFPEERRRMDIGSFYMDASLIRERYGWQPRTDLRSGLERTVAFYRQHRSWY